MFKWIRSKRCEQPMSLHDERDLAAFLHVLNVQHRSSPSSDRGDLLLMALAESSGAVCIHPGIAILPRSFDCSSRIPVGFVGENIFALNDAGSQEGWVE